MKQKFPKRKFQISKKKFEFFGNKKSFQLAI